MYNKYAWIIILGKKAKSTDRLVSYNLYLQSFLLEAVRLGLSRVLRMTLKRLAKSQRPSKARWISLSSHLLEGMSLGEQAAANGNKRTEISCVEQRALIIQWPMDVVAAASGIITRRIPIRALEAQQPPPVLFLEMSKREDESRPISFRLVNRSIFDG